MAISNSVCLLYMFGRRLYPFCRVKSLGSQVAAVSRSRQPSRSFKQSHSEILTPHVSELLAASFQVIPVLGLDSVLDGTGNRIIGAQDRALTEFDLAGSISLKPARPAT